MNVRVLRTLTVRTQWHEGRVCVECDLWGAQLVRTRVGIPTCSADVPVFCTFQQRNTVSSELLCTQSPTNRADECFSLLPYPGTGTGYKGNGPKQPFRYPGRAISPLIATTAE
eukprot:990360-Rhodomonas_salina.1